MEIKEKIEQLQKLRNNPLLVFAVDYIDQKIAIEVYQQIKHKQFKELDILLQTGGGNIDAAYTITKIFKQHSKKLNILVPLYAKSAGTLVCLGANNLIMTELSELGPLDTQIREAQEGDIPTFKSALNGIKGLEQNQEHALTTLDLAAKMIFARSDLKMSEAIKLAIEFAGKTSEPLYAQLNPKVIAEYSRALEVGEHYGRKILTKFMGWDSEKALNTIETLVYDYPSHEFVVDIKDLNELGIPAEFLPQNQLGAALELALLLLTEQKALIILSDIPNRTTAPKKKKK